jgi:hypothetical protein
MLPRRSSRLLAGGGEEGAWAAFAEEAFAAFFDL